MPSLTQQIAAYEELKKQKVPAATLQLMADATRQLVASGIEEQALQVGDKIPDFSLPNALGQLVNIRDLTRQGPVIISFYRGSWCPYCNFELAALNAALPQITAKGAQLIAISPQTPDNSFTTMEKHELEFEVLSDVGNQVAVQFGLVFTLPDSLRTIYDSFGIDVAAHNGEASFKLPIPASYVVATDGTIVNAFVNADYSQRIEPSSLVDAI